MRRSVGFRRTGGATQDVHVTPGYGPWKPTFSRWITDWTQRGDTPRIEDDGSSSWKRLRSSPGHGRDDDDDDDDGRLLTVLVFAESLFRRVGSATEKERDQTAVLADGWCNTDQLIPPRSDSFSWILISPDIFPPVFKAGCFPIRSHYMQ